LSNFYDYSAPAKASDIPAIRDRAMKLMEKKLLFAVVTDHSNPEMTGNVRKVMKWGASKRSDISFALIDCRIDYTPDCKNEAWIWGYGDPKKENLFAEGIVDSGFPNAVKAIVER
jgi:hypothetical protein